MELEAPQLTYHELLQVCPLGGTGAVDLTRVERISDGRVVDLEEQPFNMQYMSRRWSRGAVIKAVGKNGVADRAGIKAGDIIEPWSQGGASFCMASSALSSPRSLSTVRQY